MKSKRHGRLCLHVPHDRQQARCFAGFDFSQDHRFIRQDHARAPRQARRSDMLLEQPDENPAGQSAN